MKDPYCEIIGQPCKNNHTCTSNSKITDTEKDYSCKCEFGYNDNDKNCTCNTGIRIQESAKTDCSICKWHFLVYFKKVCLVVINTSLFSLIDQFCSKYIQKSSKTCSNFNYCPNNRHAVYCATRLKLLNN
jgi:hypothetical protein